MSAMAPTRPRGYRHEALVYAGLDGFLDGVEPFLRAGVDAGEPVLVVVGTDKIARLRARLGPEADGVLFADMADVGANPARIIPAWRAFLSAHAIDGRAVRGVGEPIVPERGPAELVECHRHEGLLNLAFADAADFWLLCPYDRDALPDDVVREATRTHPFVCDTSGRRESAAYLGPSAIAAPFDDPLPPPAVAFDAIAFDADGLSEVRHSVAARAAAAGLSARQADDLVLAVSEIATNTVRHGGEAGVLRTWVEDDALVCEIRDRGGVADPLAGRVAPGPDQIDGRGLWLANQLCDLVQVRAFADGGVVRLHMRRA